MKTKITSEIIHEKKKKVKSRGLEQETFSSSSMFGIYFYLFIIYLNIYFYEFKKNYI